MWIPRNECPLFTHRSASAVAGNRRCRVCRPCALFCLGAPCGPPVQGARRHQREKEAKECQSGQRDHSSGVLPPRSGGASTTMTAVPTSRQGRRRSHGAAFHCRGPAAMDAWNARCRPSAIAAVTSCPATAPARAERRHACSELPEDALQHLVGSAREGLFLWRRSRFSHLPWLCARQPALSCFGRIAGTIPSVSLSLCCWS
jgi:hypothetical protein